MSCYKYWGKIEEIADKLSNFDKTIDFDSAKHILDDEKMNRALKLIRKFYVYVGARLEMENALKK